MRKNNVWTLHSRAATLNRATCDQQHMSLATARTVVLAERIVGLFMAVCVNQVHGRRKWRGCTLKFNICLLNFGRKGLSSWFRVSKIKFRHFRPPPLEKNPYDAQGNIRATWRGLSRGLFLVPVPPRARAETPTAVTTLVPDRSDASVFCRPVPWSWKVTTTRNRHLSSKTSSPSGCTSPTARSWPAATELPRPTRFTFEFRQIDFSSFQRFAAPLDDDCEQGSSERMAKVQLKCAVHCRWCSNWPLVILVSVTNHVSGARPSCWSKATWTSPLAKGGIQG